LAEDPELHKLKLSAERLGLRWDVRLHDRQTVRYQTFLAVLRAHETVSGEPSIKEAEVGST
jgi:hypothetical protein